MRLCIVLPSLGISGGIHIAVRWAAIAARAGHEVFVAVPTECLRSPIPFLAAGDAALLRVVDIAAAPAVDLAIATWWETLIPASRLAAKRLVFLCQALESQFEADPERQARYQAFITSGVPIITIATWLQTHLVKTWGVPSTRVQTVKNPIDKTLFRPVAARVPLGNRLRCLVEGPSSEPRKNIAKTIRLLEALGIEYIWVGSVTDRTLAGPHCRGVFERVPYHEMPAIYASAQVLVKQSVAEGMFGPPLEMFACGGTAVVWAVSGHEEYMRNGDNSIIVPLGDDDGVAQALRTLARDEVFRARLSTGAAATAAAWPDWSEYGEAILAALVAVPEVDLEPLRVLTAQAQWPQAKTPVAPGKPAAAWRVGVQHLRVRSVYWLDRHPRWFDALRRLRRLRYPPKA